MSRKNDATSVFVELNEEEVKEWTRILTSFYNEKFPGRFKTDEELNAHISGVLKICQVGWSRGPKDIETRIKRKTGYGWEIRAPRKPKKTETEENIERLQKIKETTKIGNIDFIGNLDYDTALSKKEREQFRTKMETYMREFEFNESSDVALLEKLVIEEIVAKRLSVYQLMNPLDIDMSKLATEALKRVHDLQSKLGITREQRSDEIKSKAGDIATLALQLDNKLKQIHDIEKKEREEEEYYEAEKAKRDPVNILPEEEKIIATLGISESGIEAIDKDLDITSQIEKMHYASMNVETPQITEHEDVDS